MLVPWSGRAGREVGNIDNRLLDGFALTFQVLSQYLGQLWRCLRLRPGDRWHIWKRCCRSSEVKQFTADHFHLLPYGRSLARFGYRMNPALRWKFREPIQSAPRDLCGAHGENRILQGIQTACDPLLPKIRIAP